MQFAIHGISFLVDVLACQIRKADDPLTPIPIPKLKMQEIAYDAEASTYLFRPSPTKHLVTTSAAEREYGSEVICGCHAILLDLAKRHGGLDYLQVFEDQTGTKSEPLWFIEDGDGGGITALLPSDY